VLDPSIEALRNDKTLLYNAVIRAANANQVTLYTLDASGTQGHSTLGAEHSGAFIGASDAGRTTLDGMRQDNLIEPLIALASATGGTAVVNTSNFDDALAGLASDFDTYYSLGYPAPNSGDGAYHKIQVRLKRPGLSVRHRQGYVDRSPEERVADRTLSSLLLDLESNPLEVSLDFGEPQRQGKKRYRLPVMVRIPVDHVTLLDTGGTREGRLKIFLVVKDDEGGVSDLHRHAYPLNIPDEQLVDALQREIGYYATLEVRPGRPVVAVGVWDELAGSESFVQKRVLVGDTATAGR
jgi:hypothetical protein